MNCRKLIAVSWWAFGYFVVALALFTSLIMGNCLQGREGASCRARGAYFSDAMLAIAVLAYAITTWALFFRRR